MREFRLTDKEQIRARVEELIDRTDLRVMEELLDVYFVLSANAAAASSSGEDGTFLSRMRGVRDFSSWIRSVREEIAQARREADERDNPDQPAAPGEDMTSGDFFSLRPRRSGHSSTRSIER